MSSPDPIAVFEAEIVRVKTMADGSPRFELGAGEQANEYLTTLANVQASNRLCMVIVYDYDDWERMEANSR